MIAGTVLGLRFKILALVPAIAVSTVAILAAGVAQGESRWPILLALVSAATALQLGYLLGTVVNLIVVTSLFRRRPSDIVAAAQRH